MQYYERVPVSLYLFSAVLCCHLWPVWLYHIFPHYRKNGAIFRKKINVDKMWDLFSPQLLRETFLILRGIQKDMN